MATVSINNYTVPVKSKSSVLNATTYLVNTILWAIKEKKGENIISLDLRNVTEAVADYFIICEGSSTTQVKAISDNIEKLVAETTGTYPYKQEGQKNAQWILTDYIDVVVHVMHPETRNFYKLEEMWSDANQKLHDND